MSALRKFEGSMDDVVIGLGLLLISYGLTTCWRQRRGLDVVERSRGSEKVKAKVKVSALMTALELRVQRDEGHRGIANFACGPGELYHAALALLPSSHVLLLTGFPCHIHCNPPTETDGPLGALALAKAGLLLQKRVTLLTDECNEEVLLAAAAGAALPTLQSNIGLALHSFPPMQQFTESDETRLFAIASSADIVIAIERTGPNKDGKYLTMTGQDMTHLVAVSFPSLILAERFLRLFCFASCSLWISCCCYPRPSIYPRRRPMPWSSSVERAPRIFSRPMTFLRPLVATCGRSASVMEAMR